MVKVVIVVRRRDGIDRAEFLEHWRERHPPLVWGLPGLRRYVQNVAIEHRRIWPADGLAELWFDSLGDVARAFDSEAAKSLFEHEHEFIEGVEWFIAEEHEVPDPRPDPEATAREWQMHVRATRDTMTT